jgi:hypothetical protein
MAPLENSPHGSSRETTRSKGQGQSIRKEGEESQAGDQGIEGGNRRTRGRRRRDDVDSTCTFYDRCALVEEDYFDDEEGF